MDETDKRRRLALLICAHVAQFKDALNALVALTDQVTSGGLTFVGADFEAHTGLKHVSTAKMSTLLANIPTVDTYLKDNFIDDVFEAMRP